MKNSTKQKSNFTRISLVLVFILNLAVSPVFAQISFDDDARVRADSRKIRREAEKYMKARENAGDVKDSHLNMAKYSFKKGEPGYRPVDEEIETEEAYNLSNPLNKDTAVRESKKRGAKKKKS